MEMIRNVKLPDKLAETFGLSRISASSVASRDPYHVASLEQLMRVVAGVSAYNPSYTILFRGQRDDFKADDKSSILPGVYRYIPACDEGLAELEGRFRTLRRASDLLVEELDGKPLKSLWRGASSNGR